jgi:hypothetical protein
MKRMFKVQMSIEFIIILAVVLFVFLVIFRISNDRIDEFYSTERFVAAKEIADSVATGINHVFLSGMGSNSSLYIPDKLVSVVDYNITVYSNSRLVEVKWGERIYSSGIMVSVNDGSNVALVPGLVEVKYNESGVFLG